MIVRDHTSLREFLAQGHWFGGLPPALQAMIVERSSVRSFRKGQVIQREGDPGKGLYAVIEGRVGLVRRVGDAAEVLIYVGEPGFWFGEYLLLARGAPGIASVVAKGTVTALFFPSAEFERIIADEPRYFRAFADLLVARYAFIYRYVAEGPGLSREDWLHTRLADLAYARRQEMSIAGPVTLNVSQSELASMVGVSRETLRTLIARLEARGLIEAGFRSIRVLA